MLQLFFRSCGVPVDLITWAAFQKWAGDLCIRAEMSPPELKAQACSPAWRWGFGAGHKSGRLCLGILQRAVQRVRWLLCSVILQRVSPLCPLTIDRPNRLLKLKSSELLWMLCSLTSCNQVPCLQNWHSDSVLLRSASSWITLHYCLLFSDSPKLFTCIPGHWCKQTVIMGLNQHRSAVSGSSGLPAHTNLFSRCRQSEWSLIAQSRWLNATAAGWLNWTKGNSPVSLHTLYHMKQGD